jgi:branched-chain amino acid transport system permease protein
VVRGHFGWARAVGLGLAAIAYPVLLSDRWVTVGTIALIMATAAIGLHLLTGVGGQVSLGHSAFAGIGAYVATLLALNAGLPLIVAILGGGLAAGAVGAAAGRLASQLRGIYTIVVSLALVFIAQYVFVALKAVSGGGNGRSMLPAVIGNHDLRDSLTIGTVVVSSGMLWWYLALAILTLAAVTANNIRRTRFGRALVSIRERDLTAAIAGIPVTRTKTAAYAVAGVYAGVGGALLGAYLSYIVPAQWGLGLSIQFLAILVIGGLGRLAGAIAGSYFVITLPEVVKILAGIVPGISTQPVIGGGVTADLLASLLYGVAIVVVLTVEPGGMVGLYQRLREYLVQWPWTR